MMKGEVSGHISETAESVERVFQGQEIAPIRYFSAFGWVKRAVPAMVLDEPKEADEVFAVNGFTILIGQGSH